MRNAVWTSAAVHAAVTLALFLVRPAHDVLVPGPDVVQVALIDAASVAPAAAAPVQAAPEAVPASEDKGVRIEKPVREQDKPKPQASEAPTAAKPSAPTPPAPAAPSQIVLPYASVGGGMRGQVAVDESNFEFAYYLQQVRSLIARNWTPGTGVPAGTRAEVYFRVARDGSLTEPRVERSSGNPVFDQTAARAVILTGHLPPLPLGYSGSDLGVHFGFEYTGS